MAGLRCPGCAQKIPPTWHPRFVGKQAFCTKRCAVEWALEEVPRLRGYLSRISVKSRGWAADFATQALYSNLEADGVTSGDQ